MKYGAARGTWAPMVSEGTESVKPTYGEAMAFDALNEFDETLNFATGSAYGDNQEKIFISEFANGEGTVKAVYIPAKLYHAILGTQGDDEGGAYRIDDNQPLGAYGFYRTLMDSKKNKYFEVNFYPKVQGSVEGSNSKSKEDGATMEYDAIKFRIFACNKGEYKIDKRFTSEAEAIAYLDGLFAGTSTWANDRKEPETPGQGGSSGEENTGGGSEENGEENKEQEPEVTA